jgi:serine/threonine-protein kinase
MGDVYRAVDARAERTVAIKLVSAARAQEKSFLARFERESKAAALLSHPNVARVEATGSYADRPYYVMEYVEGKTLARVLDEDGPLESDRAMDLLAQACDGLAAAHANGIVHRDVKPDNLMVDKKGRLKVVDFGLARPTAAGFTITQADRVMGTPQYMAPEQATQGTADQRSDIYALGATFYHLLAGTPPFSAPTPVALMLKHVNDPLVPLEKRAESVSPSLSALIGRMLAKDPLERFQDYSELGSALAETRAELGEDATERISAGAILSPPLPAPAAPAARQVPGWVWLLAAAGAGAAAMLLARR